MKDIVLRAEQAAFDFDKRITNSEGAEFGAERGMVVLANSLGFCGSFPYTAASFSVSVIADEPSGKKHNDYWYSAEHMFHRLDAPEDVGRRAAARVVRKIGGRKVETREVPVVWEPTMTGALMGIIAGAASGESLFKRSTFLTDFEGAADRLAARDASSTTRRCPGSSARARSTARACASGATCSSTAACSGSSSSTATTRAAPAAARRAARRAWATRSASARGNLIWEAGASRPGGDGRVGRTTGCTSPT